MLYDGLCLFCGRSRKIVTFLDWFSLIKPIDVYDNNSLAQIPKEVLNIDEPLSEIHLLDKDSNTYIGFYAVRKIGIKLPLTAPFALFLYIPGMNILGEVIYRYIARKKGIF